jgi:hypothetical protein
MLWTQWKTRRKRFSELQRLGVGEKSIYAAIMCPKGPWRLSASDKTGVWPPRYPQPQRTAFAAFAFSIMAMKRVNK